MGGMRPARLDEGDRLRVMNHNEIGTEGLVLKVLFAIGEKELKGPRRRVVGSAMQGIVKGFGDLEKIITPGDDAPLAGQAHVT
jgi:hypothetical protein